MLLHLKECPYIARGKFLCPCCDQSQKFRTVSKKKCSWDRANFGEKIQRSLRASAKFLSMLRPKPVECPKCHYPLHENTSGDAGVGSGGTLYNPTELGYLENENFATAKAVIEQDYETFGPESPSKAHPEWVFEIPDTSRLELMDTSSRVELGDTGMSPIDLNNKHTSLSREPGSAGTVASSLSTSFSASINPAVFDTSFNASCDNVSPPSTVLGSCSSAQISPTSSDGSSAHRKGRQLSRVFRRTRPNSNAATEMLAPTQMAGAAINLNPGGSYVVNGSNQLESCPTGFERPDTLTINTDFDAFSSSPLSGTSGQYSGEVQTMPNYLEGFGVDFLGQLATLPVPHASPQSATTCSSAGAQSGNPEGEEDEDPLHCSICGYEPKGNDKNYRSYMSKHKKTHVGQKVPCPACVRDFTRHDNMTNHLKKCDPNSSLLRKRPGSNGNLQPGSQRKRATRALSTRC